MKAFLLDCWRYLVSLCRDETYDLEVRFHHPQYGWTVPWLAARGVTYDHAHSLADHWAREDRYEVRIIRHKEISV